MYICCTLELSPTQPATDIFIAALGELGFESFEETPSGLKAYIPDSDWNEEALRNLPYMDASEWKVQLTIEAIPTRNWNAVWESDYQPIKVGERCVVRAPFHKAPDPAVPYDLIIAPKMSFGTGHHQTTWLMLHFLLDMELSEKSLLDMGSGTGVLAILATLKGACPVTAVDIDLWAFENCRENAARNNAASIRCLQGDIDTLKGEAFDIILANINMNVLLTHLPFYGAALSEDGYLLLSGFYKSDLPALQTAARKRGLHFLEMREKEQWVAVLFRKDATPS